MKTGEHRDLSERQRVERSLRQAAELQEADTQRALRIARAALALATRIRYTTGLAGALRQLGHCHFKLGEHHAALDCYGRGLAAARRVRNVHLQASCTNGLGTTLDYLGQYELALQHFERFLVLAGGPENVRAYVVAASNIGHVLEHMGQNEAAVAHYRGALRHLDGVQVYGIPMLHMNLGVSLSLLGKSSEALASLETAFAGFRADGMALDALLAMCNIAHWHTTNGQALQAQAMMLSARNDALALGAAALLWRILHQLASAQMALGRPDEARHTLEEALAVSTRCTDAELLRDTHDTMSHVCESLGDLAAALKHCRIGAARSAELAQAASQPGVRAALAAVATGLAGRAGRSHGKVAIASLPAHASQTAAPADSRPRLSERERAVLRLAAEGCSNKAIGEALGISVFTARHHMSSVLAKLGVARRTEAVALAVARRLVPGLPAAGR